jgi:hypothetical protein
VENADVNASFVIALRHTGILQLPTDRDVGKGSTDTPEMATEKMTPTIEPHGFSRGSMSVQYPPS